MSTTISLWMMAGLSLLLVGCWAHKTRTWRWACLVCSVLLAIQPIVAALKWLGGHVGV